MPRLNLSVAVVGVLVSVLLAGCSGGLPGPTVDRTQTPAVPATQQARVLFDMGHGEIFGAEDTTGLGQSRAVEHISEVGLDVYVNRSRFTTESVADVSGIILPGPMSLPTFEEQDVLEHWVRDGGVLVVTTHVAYPIMVLPDRYGLGFTRDIIESEMPLPGGDPGTFLATTIETDELTQNVEELFVLSTWAIETSGDRAEIVISSDSDTWADSDANGSRDDTDAVGPLGIVGVSRLGEGTVVLIGDDAVFANVAIDQADNLRLFDNILRLMGAHALQA